VLDKREPRGHLFAGCLGVQGVGMHAAGGGIDVLYAPPCARCDPSVA
jgi:hypothetical protein